MSHDLDSQDTLDSHDPESQDTLELADRLVAAIEAGDIDSLRRIYAPTAEIWHNFDQLTQTVDENLATLQWLVERLPERRYDVVRRERLPDGFVQQHVLVGTTRSGGRLEMPACLIVRVAEGCITRLDEYLDPAQAAVLRKS